MRSLDVEQAEAVATTGEFPETFDGPQPPLRVAAVVSLPPTNDDRGGSLLSLVTPAFLERYDGRIPTFGALVQVRLRPGASVAELSRELEALPGGDRVERDAAGTGSMDAAGSALDTVALGLAAMAVVAAIAGLVVIGQAVTRLLMSGADDLPVLSAMGLSPAPPSRPCRWRPSWPWSPGWRWARPSRRSWRRASSVTSLAGSTRIRVCSTTGSDWGPAASWP